MKKIILLYFFLFLTISCKAEPLPEDVLVCYEIYLPVCGSDGKTYPNDCYAERESITEYISGECSN